MNTVILKIINQILKSNSGSLNLLTKYHGKSFKINTPLFSLNTVINSNGFLDNSNSNQYDVTIEIPLNTATYIVNNDKIELFRKLKFTGDSELGKTILEIFANLHFSGLYSKFNSPIMLTIISQLNNFFTTIKQEISSISTNLVDSSKEYLLYETEDLITPFEHEKFCNEVDELRGKTDQLEHKINSLIAHL